MRRWRPWFGLMAIVLVVRPAGAALATGAGWVVSASEPASAAGQQVLRQGGNATDAAIATAFALAVTYPSAGNLGGGGFALVQPAQGAAVAVDFREVAPGRAHRDLFLDEQGDVVPHRSTTGYLAQAVPGTVAGLGYLFENYASGRLTWGELVEPARRLAEEGFPVSPHLARHLREHARRLGLSAAGRRIFLRDGAFYEPGDILVQPELAQTLARIQREGAQEFYLGETARLLVADQQREGGLISAQDLADYRVVAREPLRGHYRGYEVITMPPPSSGGVALLQMLGMLEPHDVGAMPPGSAQRIHLLIEVMRRAFRDRARYLGDPDFVAVPVRELLAPEYVRGLMADFAPRRATPSEELAPVTPPEPMQTTHFSVVSAAGDAVALTYTLNGNYGSGICAAGTGILLNNEMDDFTAKPGVANMFGLVQSEANAIAPRKRPLSSMTPTILRREGTPVLVTGSPGGPTIITTVLRVVLAVVDDRLSVAEAVAAPRLHHQWLPDSARVESGFLADEVAAELRAMGHQWAPSDELRRWGDAASIGRSTPEAPWIGAADPRSPDAAARGH